MLQAREGETIKPILDLTNWLDSETISAVSITSDGATLSHTESNGVITLTVSGVNAWHDATITVTTSGGRVLKERIRITEPHTTYRDDYRSLIWV